MKNKEIVQTGFEKFLDEFDEKYGKNIHKKHKTIPILLNLFEEYEEKIYSTKRLDKEIQKLQFEINSRLKEICNEEQNELISQLQYCMGMETGELVQRGFIYGYCVAQSLNEESKDFSNKKNKYCN